jgi:hypothetical protein
MANKYEDYERVKTAFKGFIHAMVWEDIDIDCGVHEDVVNAHIDKFCDTNGDQLIELMNSVMRTFVRDKC